MHEEKTFLSVISEVFFTSRDGTQKLVDFEYFAACRSPGTEKHVTVNVGSFILSWSGSNAAASKSLFLQLRAKVGQSSLHVSNCMCCTLREDRAIVYLT